MFAVSTQLPWPHKYRHPAGAKSARKGQRRGVGAKRRVSVGGAYCQTALPGSRHFSTKHPGGRRGCSFVPGVVAQARRLYRTGHTRLWGSASGLALGGGVICALGIWLLQHRILGTAIAKVEQSIKMKEEEWQHEARLLHMVWVALKLCPETPGGGVIEPDTRV